jgi:hypothetical protein
MASNSGGPLRRSGLRRRNALFLLVVGGCGGSQGVKDASAPEVAPYEIGKESPVLARPDARIGFPGGSACEASTQCLSGACTLGACSDWARAMRIGIDTTTAGADVPESVSDFPLLVRLNATNFAFAEAQGDGADIRFLDGEGTGLRYEIERWDAEHETADVWVLLPRLAGSSSQNFIVLLWGNPFAAPASSGPPVFGSQLCVLHMTAGTDGAATRAPDSSGQGNTGLLQNPPVTAAPTDGIAGSGLVLDAKGSYLSTSSRLASPQTFSISMWFKTTSAVRGGLAGFASRPSGSDVHYDRAITMDEDGRLSFGILRGGNLMTVSSLSSYNDGDWHFAVARFGSAGQYLFVDGEPVADDPAMVGSDTYDGYWRFGQEPLPGAPQAGVDAASPAGNFFSGTLDEIRVDDDAVDDGWIKLSYATQRPGTDVVAIGEPL